MYYNIFQYYFPRSIILVYCSTTRSDRDKDGQTHTHKHKRKSHENSTETQL